MTLTFTDLRVFVFGSLRDALHEILENCLLRRYFRLFLEHDG